MFEYAADRYLTVGSGEQLKIYSVDVRRSLLLGTSYVVGVWDPQQDYNSSNILEPSTKPIGFGRDENGNSGNVSAIFTDKDLKVYSRVTTPLLSSVVIANNVPTGYYNSGTRQYYTTGNTIYNHTNSLSSVVQRKNENGEWVGYIENDVSYNPTGIVKDKRSVYWICSSGLGRIGRLTNNIDNLTGSDFTLQAGRIDYEEEIYDKGELLHPTGLAVLPEKSSMPDTDLDEYGRMWICCTNGNIYEIGINLGKGLEMIENMGGVGIDHFITVYNKEIL